MEVTITEAARRLGISERTVRRRLHSEELMGRQVTTPQGFVWTVDMPDDMSDDQPDGKASDKELEAFKEMVDILRDQVQTKDQQIKELHILLQQTQAALPAPKENHHASWRRFWQRK